ncbi:hypothetical protein K458DRAFT_432621 [Lentithecium fluviatile CBS 122367]|uniref:Uncharacterized protein n=1 Tax=Lentithecium fluviatile CBS 122367 TaxID=1168545 RepID=A0A6G1IWL4_9PLEO|nr:hypothetical protein K458DRAFT_432621 [Lentithecium fluviatile CBS 122367]
MDTTEPFRPIWQSAIDRYYGELEEGGMRRTPAIEQDLWEIESPIALIDEIQSMVPQESAISNVWATALPRLEPVLLGLNDFAAVIAWSLGMNGRVAALRWGSIRLILKFARPMFPQLITILEELRNVLPKAHISEQELPISESLETALVNMYTEIIVFYAFAITFFRNNPNATNSRHAWSAFNSKFEQVISNLRKYSRKVDEIVDMVRLSKETHSAETIKAIQNLKKLMISDRGTSCYMIPFGTNLKFYGRTAEMQELKGVLNPGTEHQTLRSYPFVGWGGDLYDAIAWVQADTQTKFVQGLVAFSSKLGLPKEAGREDDYQSIQKVRDWLNSSGKKFLIIFDNLEDVRIFSQIWPTASQGSVIITTRSPAAAAGRAKTIMQLKSFEKDTAVDILYELTGLQPLDNNDAKAAREICQLISGLPLAMVHMSSFIQDRGYSYEEFLALYKKHAERIFLKDQSQVDYDHTLNTMWGMSLLSLSKNARVLLDLLSFFDPDSIPERLFIDTGAKTLEPRLAFLTDEFDFGDAVSELMTKTSLINRSAFSKSLSLHRLVKFAMFIRVPEEECTLYLDSTIQLLYHAFPNTWDTRGPEQGHGWRSWESCSAIVAHLSSLMGLQKQYNLKATNVDVFSELVFRIGTYLWECEQPTTAKSFFEYGLGLGIEPDSRISAQAYRLLGHIGLDVAQPRAALTACQKALAAREKIEEPESPAIAEVYDSIACRFSEIGDVTKALDYLEKADKINCSHFNRTSARTQAIYALAYLRGEQPEKALEALRLCWKLQDKRQEEIAESKYPKHAGDIVLLARIHYALGQKEEAQRLASRSINIRRGIFGAKGPRVADSIFVVTRMLVAEGEHVVAARMLREVIDMSRGMGEMKGHLARPLWFLASTEEALENLAEAERLRKEANEEKKDCGSRGTRR